MATSNELDQILEEVLRSRGELSLPARGFSMGVSYRNADALVLRPVARVRIGTVLVYRRGGLWVAHRVIWVFPDRDARLCLTKGDAVRAVDHPAVMKGEEIAVVSAIRTARGVTDLATPWNRAREMVRGIYGLVCATLPASLRRLYMPRRRANPV